MKSKNLHRLEAAVAELKPLLRGWLHAGAAIAALPLTIALCWSCLHDTPRMYTLLIFGISMILLYAVSALYHIGRWRGRWYRFFQVFDHANIFVFIAATYTPFYYTLLGGWQRTVLLGAVWVMAATGVMLTVFKPRLPRPFKTSLYILMGWCGLLALPTVLSLLPMSAVGLLILGGILYTIGGVIFALRWPDPFPRVFGFHEIFHLLVVAAGVVYILAIWFWVVPFSQA